MNKLTRTTIMLAALALLVTAPVLAQSLKSAAKSVNAELEGVTITAKLPLKFKARYHVTGQGDPWGSDDKQGRRTGLARSGDMAFLAGDTKKQLWVGPKSGSEILVRMFCCGNKSRSLFSTTQHADFIVHLDPPITPEQLTAQLIANALSGFFDVEGYGSQDASAAIENLTNELSSDTPHHAVGELTPDSAEVTVVNATVSTSVAVVRRGDSIDLLLDYAVNAPDGGTAQVDETRTLSFGGAQLPGYPNTTILQRAAGRFSSRLPQQIPAAAALGEYEYRGEVCVAGECVSRRETFKVVD